MAPVSFALLTVFLLLGWQVVRQVLRPGPMLRMDARVIDHAQYGPIPWGNVVGMELQSIRVRHSTQYTLMLGVRGARRYLRNAPPLARWLQGRRMRGDDDLAALPIPLNLLEKSPDLIHRSALALRQRHDAPFLEDWHHRMEQREVEALLRMQDLDREHDDILEELRALPADAGPERIAALDARVREHFAGQNAALPELRVTMDRHARRAKQDIRGLRIMLVVIVGLTLLSLALRLLR
ncbi:hypothetical protein H1235_02390 [Pseudoxanthomonas sp. NC8]|nr:hypothetical protein H1235_02390 [Pseudoxanthomonas sp. NC8]